MKQVVLKQVNRATWDARTLPANAADLMKRLRASGLPLSDQTADIEEESDNSKITALISIVDTTVDAYVATPSGILYRFSPGEFDAEWWAFALRNYYCVTGSMADRLKLAEMASVDLSKIKGKVVIRTKSADTSGLTLDQLLDQVAPALAGQANLFA